MGSQALCFMVKISAVQTGMLQIMAHPGLARVPVVWVLFITPQKQPSPSRGEGDMKRTRRDCWVFIHAGLKGPNQMPVLR
jgi:hypothetical protein